MNLDILIKREGEERLRAGHAATRSAELAHLALADMFRDRIDFRRRTAFARAGADPAMPLPRP